MKTRTRKQTKTSQIVVPTPLWLQRRMLKNLQLAASSKVSPARAQRAIEILAKTRVDSQPQTELVRKSCVDALSPASKTALAWSSKIRRLASAVFSKVRSCLNKATAFSHLGLNPVVIESSAPADIERSVVNQRNQF